MSQQHATACHSLTLPLAKFGTCFSVFFGLAFLLPEDMLLSALMTFPKADLNISAVQPISTNLKRCALVL